MLKNNEIKIDDPKLTQKQIAKHRGIIILPLKCTDLRKI